MKSHKHPVVLVLFLAFFLCSSNSVFAQSLCDTVKRACSSNDKHVVLAEAEIANQILEVIKHSAKRYEDYFSWTTEPVAVVSGGVVDAELEANLNSAGYTIILPWFSSADRHKLNLESVRRAVEEQTTGLPDALKKEVMEKALAQVKPADTDQSKSLDELEMGALSHELGHLWFIRQYSREESGASSAPEYASWAPDWLDESVAVLLENEELTTSRRQQFRDTADTGFVPLKEFFSMQHPVFNAAQSLVKHSGDENDSEGSSVSKAIILTGDEAEAFFKGASGDPAGFYLQVRFFVDFLFEKSNDPGVIDKIAMDMVEGKTIEEWILSNEYSDLPNDVDQLINLWQQWLKVKKLPVT